MHKYREFSKFPTNLHKKASRNMPLMRSIILYGAAVLLYAATLSDGYADPGECLGSCHLHDPALIQRESDGKWFKFTSHNLIGVTVADNLTGPWTDAGSVLTGQSVIDLPGRTDIWAPDVHKYGDFYYCFYAVSVFTAQDSAIGVAVSPNMEPGTWEDKGAIFTSKVGDPYNAIDPAFIEAENGDLYMAFGSFWQGIFVTKMDSPLEPTGTPINIACNTTGTDREEGSYLYFNDGYYYLFYSTGVCCAYDQGLPAQGEEYRVNVCRSKDITGPYVDAQGVACTEGGGTTLLASHGTCYGPGGQQVYKNILYYHYVDTTTGGYADMEKFFGWNELTWANGWPTV